MNPARWKFLLGVGDFFCEGQLTLWLSLGLAPNCSDRVFFFLIFAFGLLGAKRRGLQSGADNSTLSILTFALGITTLLYVVFSSSRRGFWVLISKNISLCNPGGWLLDFQVGRSFLLLGHSPLSPPPPPPPPPPWGASTLLITKPNAEMAVAEEQEAAPSAP